MTKIKNAEAGITISKAAAIKLPIIPTAELFATSAEKSAASNKFEIWNTFNIKFSIYNTN